MRRIDGKFHIEGERIIHPSGHEVPEEEPLFLLRARDRNAIRALEAYRDICRADGCNDYQLGGIESALAAFIEFRQSHPEQMKQPGITRGR